MQYAFTAEVCTAYDSARSVERPDQSRMSLLLQARQVRVSDTNAYRYMGRRDVW